MKPAWLFCFEAANELLTSGNYKKAAEAYGDAILSCDDQSYRSRIRSGRGLALMLANRHADAIADLTIAIGADSRQADLYQVRGICYRRINQPVKALADFDRAIHLGKTDIDLYINRGSVYLLLGMIELAVLDLVHVMEVNMEKATHLERLVVRELDRRWAEAETAEELSTVFTCFAQIKLAAGDNLGAVRDCSRAVQQNPDNLFAFYLAALGYVRLGRADEARVTFQHCRDLGFQQCSAVSRELAQTCDFQLQNLGVAA